MLSMTIKPSVSCTGSFKTYTFTYPSPNPIAKILVINSIFATPKVYPIQSPTTLSNLKFNRRAIINTKLSASSASAVQAFAEEETPTEDSTSSIQPQKEEVIDIHKLGVVVKPMQKPSLVLKFVWMEKNIGLALNQVIPGHGTIPLSPYYFWPRKDAWEELKVMLESKPWISQKQMIILLNQATDIINLWQQSGGDLL
ncbi:unnamed protein product [Camellia sinensis]